MLSSQADDDGYDNADHLSKNLLKAKLHKERKTIMINTEHITTLNQITAIISQFSKKA